MADRMRVANWERWGRLVKTWATGENRLGDGNSYPLPRTLQEFAEQCARAQVGAYIPENVKSFAVVQYDSSTMVLRLPPKDLVLMTEAHLKSGGAYPLPNIYCDAFGLPSGTEPQFADIDAVLTFHDRRIGDYTISYCG